MYRNIDERYGGQEWATLADYFDLNSAGRFEQRTDGLYEQVDDKWVKVAEWVEFRSFADELHARYPDVTITTDEKGYIVSASAEGRWAVAYNPSSKWWTLVVGSSADPMTFHSAGSAIAYAQMVAP